MGVRLTAWLLVVVPMAGAGCGTVRTKPNPDALEVESLNFEGTQQVAERDIRERIVTAPSPWWPSWTPFVGRTEWFDANTWQADLRRITRVYEAHGFYQARIVDDVVTETERQSVKLTVTVFEGTPARVRRLDIVGLEGVEGLSANLRSKLRLRPGDVFLESHWNDDKRRIVESLHEAGYAEAGLSAEAMVDVDGAKVDVSMVVDPGVRYRFGDVFVPVVVGRVVPSRLIKEQAQIELPPGEWYSDSALVEAQARIFRMGAFGAVKVNRMIPDRERGILQMSVEAKEAAFRSRRFGFGAGGDLIRNDVRVFGEYIDRNFGLSRLFAPDAVLDKLTLRGKVGYAVLPNLPDFIRRSVEGDEGVQHGPIGDLSAEYEVPRVFNTRTVSLQSSLGVTRTLDNAFNYWSAETKVGFRWEPTVHVTVEPSVRANAYLLQSEIPQAITPTGAIAPSAAIGCPLFPAVCFVGFLELNAEWDRRDNKLAPKEGFFFSASTQTGFSQTTRLTPFVRFLPEARGYFSFGEEKRLTVAGKLRAGWLFGIGEGETPIVARFFSGGAYMRGFNQRRLSPMAVVRTGEGPLPSNELGLDGRPLCQRSAAGECIRGDLGTTVPIGGDGLFEGSVEVRYEILDKLTLAVFFDAGMVTADPLLVNTNWARDFYTAVGIGLRYRTPLAPIRLDLAYRLPFVGGPLLNKDPAQPAYFTQSGCFFNLGATSATNYAGAPDSVCTFHLSIGEAF
jgi:translocation and assembly module TamA